MATAAAPKNVSPEEPPDVEAFMAQVIAAPIEPEPEPVSGTVAEGIEPERYLPAAYSASPQTDHVIVGLGQLAKLPEAEFRETLRLLKVGRERVETIQKELMQEGTDYGKVAGIGRPFLHLPGAEVMEKFYGYVTEQRTVRIDGRRAIIKIGDTEAEMGEWLSPPVTYRTDSFVHLGDITGPVIAMVSATCNSWETKYRYRNVSPTCPECGRPDLIRRKNPPNLAGKWQCPAWGGKGGCNRVFEPNDERIKPGGKVENPDYADLDETLIQMSQKRSYVAAIRRATGTSGLFTIDDDSPSVQEQSNASAPEDFPTGEPPVEAVAAAPAERGGKQALASMAQIAEVGRISKEKDLGPVRIAEIIERVTGTAIDVGEGDRRAQSTILLNAMKALSADNLGAVIQTLLTGEVPAEEATPGWPPQDS